MRLVYFVYQDKNAYERQSDGVEFCKIPEFHNDKIYFYCDEYLNTIKIVTDANSNRVVTAFPI
ncbi:hypothetical protein [Proteus mirabilis]|uniref:hypothetical protein n=1 Tax=Proteus mirabilis TaxID=584 RepID=UPI00235F4E67|nr:hypothetical protein [Proteus mirabilis]MDC9763886.1 hypothetical protein [Proteus mirabilis]